MIKLKLKKVSQTALNAYQLNHLRYKIRTFIEDKLCKRKMIFHLCVLINMGFIQKITIVRVSCEIRDGFNVMKNYLCEIVLNFS